MSVESIFLDLQRQSKEARAKALATPMNRKASPCDTCAFKEGSETTAEPYTVLKAQICVLSGHAFFCHHATDLHKKSRNQATRAELRANGICHSWKTEVGERVRKGWFPPQLRRLRHAFGTLAIGLLEEFVDAKEGIQKRAALKRLKAAIKILASKRLAGDMRNVCN
jgi:hypothetical protein